MMKEKVLKFLGFDVKEPEPLTEREQRMQAAIDREINMQKMVRNLTFIECFGIHYSIKYLQTHTPLEIEARYRSDVNELKRILEEYEQSNEQEE